ncbi:MAG: DNA-binding response regulator, CheY like [Nitrospira sp.]|jgi:two-component system response regulator|nr:DNA-binding response regulator, CheY like [Nitrospira sp.]
MHRPTSVLLIDDSPGERELFREALMRTDFDVVLYSEQDAEAALHFLKHRPELPSLVLLDWHLRHERGDVFLKRLRSEGRFAAIPVVAFTTSDQVSDLSAAYANAVNGYVVKPATFEDLVQCVGDICRYWLTRNRTPYFVETPC